MNNLFISGNIRIGKSSLIRKCLSPYKDTLGGFSSQRLLDISGNIVGYRITDAQDFEVERLYEPSLSGIFMIRGNGGNNVDLSAFRDFAIKLIPSEQTSIMLLDEIGGVELLDTGFRDRLYKLLRSDTPCIGVLKDAAYSKASPDASDASSIKKENFLLRSFLDNDPGSCIISLPDVGPLFGQNAADTYYTTEKHILDFLTKAAHTS